jgi:hypothetical protein
MNLMAKPVRPAHSKPDELRGSQEAANLIRRVSANTIRARGDNTPHKIGRIYGCSLILWFGQQISKIALASRASPYMSSV